MKSKNLTLSVTLAIAAVIMASCTKVLTNSRPENQSAAISQSSNKNPETAAAPQISPEDPEVLLSQSFSEDQEYDAFFSSSYRYCDAEILSEFWGMERGETKMRIGRKILWGEADIGILDQYLVDARIQALQALDNDPNRELCYYGESVYTYDDAVALAEYWGELSPWDAKLRIERNMLLNNENLVYQALALAQRQDS